MADLDLVQDFLRGLPKFQLTGDGTWATCECWVCGGYEDSSQGSMSIKFQPEDGEVIGYNCFRASCGVHGMLRPEDLERMGCMDPNTLIQLANHNAATSGKPSNKFIMRKQRDFTMVNLNNETNQLKLAYINKRLGTKFTTSELRDYKIQLSLYDFIRINNIHQLAYSERYCDVLNKWCIGFVSAYQDYLILRDISKKEFTGKRYTQYRIMGKSEKGDTKIYTIPRDIDLLDPHPADINLAEGAFSLLGAYLHTGDVGFHHPNSVWAANCGSQYRNTLMHLTRQYGLLDVCLHVWSDSEIKIEKYEQLIREVKDHMNLVSVQIHYNERAEDFGHAKKDIGIYTIQLK